VNEHGVPLACFPPLASPIRDFGAAKMRDSLGSMMDGNVSRFGFPIRFVLSVSSSGPRDIGRVYLRRALRHYYVTGRRGLTRVRHAQSFRETVLPFEKLISRRRYRAVASPIKISSTPRHHPIALSYYSRHCLMPLLSLSLSLSLSAPPRPLIGDLSSVRDPPRSAFGITSG